MCQRTAHMQAQWQLDAHRLFPRRSRNCAHQDDTNVAGHCLGLWTASSLHDARVLAAPRPRHPSWGLCTDAFCADVLRPRTLWCGFLLSKYIAILRQSYVSKWHMRVFLGWDIIDIMYIYLIFHNFVVGPYAQCRELFVFMCYIHIYTWICNPYTYTCFEYS